MANIKILQGFHQWIKLENSFSPKKYRGKHFKNCTWVMFEDVENNIKRQDTFNYTHKHAPTQYWFNPVPRRCEDEYPECVRHARDRGRHDSSYNREWWLGNQGPLSVRRHWHLCFARPYITILQIGKGMLIPGISCQTHRCKSQESVVHGIGERLQLAEKTLYRLSCHPVKFSFLTKTWLKCCPWCNQMQILSNELQSY